MGRGKKEKKTKRRMRMRGAKVKSGREPKRKKKLGVGSVGEDAPLCVLCPEKRSHAKVLWFPEFTSGEKLKKSLIRKGGKACVRQGIGFLRKTRIYFSGGKLLYAEKESKLRVI